MMGLLSKVQGRKAPNIVRQEVHSAGMKLTAGIEGDAMRTRKSSSNMPTGKLSVFRNTTAAFEVKTRPIR
jgi:hypothetical protein